MLTAGWPVSFPIYSIAAIYYIHRLLLLFISALITATELKYELEISHIKRVSDVLASGYNMRMRRFAGYLRKQAQSGPSRVWSCTLYFTCWPVGFIEPRVLAIEHRRVVQIH